MFHAENKEGKTKQQVDIYPSLVEMMTSDDFKQNTLQKTQKMYVQKHAGHSITDATRATTRVILNLIYPAYA